MCTVIVLIIVFISCSLYSIIFSIYCYLCVLSPYIYIYIYTHVYVLHIYSIFVIHTVILLSLHKSLSPPVHLRSWYCVFLLFYVLDVVSITVYDRDTLLNIGSSVTQRKSDFEFLNAGGLFTDTASEPFVWVAQSRKRLRHRKRGKRAGDLVRLRCRAFRPPLPIILVANVQSLDNKLCKLRSRISYQRETRDCCVICLTETWMSAMVPDSAIELTGFSVHRWDRTKELTGKSRGGGVCFYINNSWCNERNIHSIKSFCSPDLEFHMLLCRPFWLPREFTAIIITAVYIPPKPTQTRHSGNCTGI